MQRKRECKRAKHSINAYTYKDRNNNKSKTKRNSFYKTQQILDEIAHYTMCVFLYERDSNKGEQ